MAFRSRTCELASRIKSTLIQIDMNIAVDTAQMKVADADYRKYIHSNFPNLRQKGVVAQAMKLIYSNHIQDLTNARAELLANIDFALRGFPESWRTVWKMYYFTSLDVNDIGDRTGYAGEYVRKIIRLMKSEMEKDNGQSNKDGGVSKQEVPQKEAGGDQAVQGDGRVEENEGHDPH